MAYFYTDGFTKSCCTYLQPLLHGECQPSPPIYCTVPAHTKSMDNVEIPSTSPDGRKRGGNMTFSTDDKHSCKCGICVSHCRGYNFSHCSTLSHTCSHLPHNVCCGLNESQQEAVANSPGHSPREPACSHHIPYILVAVPVHMAPMFHASCCTFPCHVTVGTQTAYDNIGHIDTYNECHENEPIDSKTYEHSNSEEELQSKCLFSKSTGTIHTNDKLPVIEYRLVNSDSNIKDNVKDKEKYCMPKKQLYETVQRVQHHKNESNRQGTSKQYILINPQGDNNNVCSFTHKQHSDVELHEVYGPTDVDSGESESLASGPSMLSKQTESDKNLLINEMWVRKETNLHTFATDIEMHKEKGSCNPSMRESKSNERDTKVERNIERNQITTQENPSLVDFSVDQYIRNIISNEGQPDSPVIRNEFYNQVGEQPYEEYERIKNRGFSLASCLDYLAKQEFFNVEQRSTFTYDKERYAEQNSEKDKCDEKFDLLDNASGQHYVMGERVEGESCFNKLNISTQDIYFKEEIRTPVVITDNEEIKYKDRLDMEPSYYLEDNHSKPMQFENVSHDDDYLHTNISGNGLNNIHNYLKNSNSQDLSEHSTFTSADNQQKPFSQSDDDHSNEDSDDVLRNLSEASDLYMIDSSSHHQSDFMANCTRRLPNNVNRGEMNDNLFGAVGSFTCGAAAAEEIINLEPNLSKEFENKSNETSFWGN